MRQDPGSKLGPPSSLIVVALLVFMLSPPAGAQAPPVITDTFNASRLDLGKWDPFPNGGASASTGAGLQIALNGSNSFSTVRVFTFYQLTGDFDAQVDFTLGTGWNNPFPGSDSSPQLNGGAIGVYLDDPN